MKIYGHPRTRSLRAVWAAEEAGLDYEYVKIRLIRGEHKQPGYLALNRGGKVPTLVDADLVLTESFAICSYIGSRVPGSGLVPTDARERAPYDQWGSFAITELEQPLWTMAKHTFVLPEEYR
jgi:glutathione S-transferase